MMDDRHPVIETPRLRLREITLDDAPWYLTHYNEISIVEGNCQLGPADLNKAKEDLTYFCSDLHRSGLGYRWGVELKDNKGLIGTCGFHNWDRAGGRTHVGYDLNPAYRGRGIMTEALEAIIDFAFFQMNSSEDRGHR